MNVRFTFEGTTPLLMHNPRMVDKEFEIVRQIKAITDKRKKTDEDLREVGRLEWYGGIYTMLDEKGVERVSQPTSKVRKCLIETGKIYKQGKDISRAINMTALDVPLIYVGPPDKDKLFKDKSFHARLSVGVGRRRVMRVRPQFVPWKLVCEALFVEDAGLNLDELKTITRQAGIVEGLGDGRAIGYGRFVGKVEEI